jgi:hypothetical protein
VWNGNLSTLSFSDYVFGFQSLIVLSIDEEITNFPSGVN